MRIILDINKRYRRFLSKLGVIIVLFEPLAKVFFIRLSVCNKCASQADPWYSVSAKRRFFTGDASEAEKDNIMADGNAATEFITKLEECWNSPLTEKERRLA